MWSTNQNSFFPTAVRPLSSWWESLIMDISRSCSPHCLPCGVYTYKCTTIVTIAHKAAVAHSHLFAPFIFLCTKRGTYCFELPLIVVVFFNLLLHTHSILFILCRFNFKFYYILAFNEDSEIITWNLTTLNLESEQGQDVDSPETQFSTCFGPIVFGLQTL